MAARSTCQSVLRRTCATPRQCVLRPRQFHSYDHPQSARANNVEEAILSAAYKHVPEHGFSQQSLGMGARDAGYLDISASVMPNGAFSLINYHLVRQRKELAARSEQLFSQGSAPASTDAKVEMLAWERLVGNTQIINQWQEALAIMAQPTNLPHSLKELAQLSDDILFLAGDKAVDYTWYTKRTALSVLYSTTELFMTNDKSPEFIETKQFLARRIKESNSISGAVGSTSQWVGFTLSAGVNVLRSKGVRI